MTLLPDLAGDGARWGAGFPLAAAVAALAWRVGALAPSGALAAVVIGGVVVGAGGWWLAGLLILFFATSSALSRLRQQRRRGGEAVVHRGSRRDAVQVLANGGAAAVGALFFAATGEPAWLLGAACGLAAANADTWSTEVGRWVGRQPRLITSGRRVAPGTSGGITVPGTAAAVAGAGLVAAGAALGAGLGFLPSPLGSGGTLAPVLAAGFAGALLDSLLGATVQRVYRCPRCGGETEQPRHRCGARTLPVRGLPGVTNDTVNALATLLAAALGAAVGLAVGVGYRHDVVFRAARRPTRPCDTVRSHDVSSEGPRSRDQAPGRTAVSSRRDARASLFAGEERHGPPPTPHGDCRADRPRARRVARRDRLWRCDRSGRHTLPRGDAGQRRDDHDTDGADDFPAPSGAADGAPAADHARA